MSEELVILGRDNAFILTLSSDSVAIDNTSITKIDLVIGETIISSATHPTWFDTSVAGKVTVKLGQSSLTAGRYYCSIVVYDALNTHGIDFGRILLSVKEGLNQVI